MKNSFSNLFWRGVGGAMYVAGAGLVVEPLAEAPCITAPSDQAYCLVLWHEMDHTPHRDHGPSSPGRTLTVAVATSASSSSRMSTVALASTSFTSSAPLRVELKHDARAFIFVSWRK